MAGRRNDEWERAVAAGVCAEVFEEIQRQGLTHITLAERMGVRREYVKAMLAGKTMKGDQLGIQAALKLARCTGLDVSVTVGSTCVTDDLVRE